MVLLEKQVHLQKEVGAALGGLVGWDLSKRIRRRQECL